MLLREWFGINIYALGFNLLSFWGLTLTYLYFQIPLMVLILTPALDGLKREWREAATILGASTFQYWRMVALPILWPTLLGTTLLLFANAFGAIATAYALTGSSLNIVPILLFAQIRGDVLHDPHLGYALALGMIVITGVSNVLYIWLRSPQPSGGCDERAADRALAWLAFAHRHALLLRAADRHLRVLAAHAPRRLQLRRLSRRPRRPARSRRPSAIRRSWRS